MRVCECQDQELYRQARRNLHCCCATLFHLRALEVEGDKEVAEVHLEALQELRARFLMENFPFAPKDDDVRSLIRWGLGDYEKVRANCERLDLI